MRGRNIHKIPRKGVENFQKSPSEPCYIFFLTFHFLSWQHEVCHLEPQEHNFTLLLMRFFLSIFTQSSWCGFARKYGNVFIPPISSICIINRALFLCVSAFKIFCFNAKLLRTIKHNVVPTGEHVFPGMGNAARSQLSPDSGRVWKTRCIKILAILGCGKTCILVSMRYLSVAASNFYLNKMFYHTTLQLDIK